MSTRQGWTIVDRATGAVIHNYFETPAFGSHPKDNHWRWDAETQLAHRVDHEPDPAAESWNGSAWVLDAAKLDVAIEGRIERLASAAIGAACAGQAEMLTIRWRELVDFRSVGTAALAALGSAQRLRRWPLLAMLAEESGRSIEDAAATAEAIVWPKVRRLARINARAMIAAERVRAAATREAKEAAAVVDWTAGLG